MKNIRNFSIIAHINHGKSTLADRLIELCTGLSFNQLPNQSLDSMDLEKEKGITIKARNVTLFYTHPNTLQQYQLNLIDTPGHADFIAEVSRSLRICEGALLLIDICKGIQAQTIAYYNLAKSLGLKIIIVLNKIDLIDNINYHNIIANIKKILNYQENIYLLCSAKHGKGIKSILKAIIKYVPSPIGASNTSLEAIIIDTWFDTFLGIICLIYIKQGYIKLKDKIKLLEINKKYEVKKLGLYLPNSTELLQLTTGQIGWIVYGEKNYSINPLGFHIVNVNNNIIISNNLTKHFHPQLYISIYPNNSNEFVILQSSLKKLYLNDASFSYEQINSYLLGFGFKCGFLGLLHMEIISERLKREYKLSLLITLPIVNYYLKLKNNNIISINSNLFNYKNINNYIKNIYEPIAECIIITPKIYLGNIITLCINKRGKQKKINFYNNEVILIYHIPMAELIINFINQLQTISHGYASLKYNFIYYKISQISILDILINKKSIDNFIFFVHNNKIKIYTKMLLDIFNKYLPKQQFEMLIQIRKNNQIIASNKIKPLRKNVLSKCYGGDISRKKKLLNKQKLGKQKMKTLGKINLPKQLGYLIFNYEKNIV